MRWLESAFFYLKVGGQIFGKCGHGAARNASAVRRAEDAPGLDGAVWVAGWDGCHDAMAVSTLEVSTVVVSTVVVLTMVVSTMLVTMVSTTRVKTTRVETTAPSCDHLGGIHHGGLSHGSLSCGDLHYGGLQLDGLDYGGLNHGGLNHGGLDAMSVSSPGRPWAAGAKVPGLGNAVGCLQACEFWPRWCLQL